MPPIVSTTLSSKEAIPAHQLPQSIALRAIAMIPSQRESYTPNSLGPTLGTAFRAGDLGRIGLGRHIR